RFGSKVLAANSLPALLCGMGNGNITMNRRGEFLEISDEDGQVKRVVRGGGDTALVPVKKLFIKLSDVCSVALKAEESDVMFTLENGVEYVLNGLEDAEATYSQFVEFIAAD
ncbi:unnamed protein product, partial [Durusdinium trenchii]